MSSSLSRTSGSHSQTATPSVTGLVAIGFLSLAGAVLFAHNSPASGYEISLYTATPLSVWILLGIAFTISLIGALETRVCWLRRLSLCLGGLSALVFVGMPILRGYRFISGGDALTHLGWARGLQAGGFHPTELRYSGFHTVSILVSSTLDVDLTYAMMFLIVSLFGLFFLFISLSTVLVYDSEYSFTIGAFSAFLLLPITTLSTHIPPHAMSQAILFSTVSVYLFLKYVRSRQPTFSLSATGGFLAITSVALVLYHPQLAAHVLVMFVGICAIQLLFRFRSSSDPVASHRLFVGQTGVLGLAFAVWIANHELIRNVARFHLLSTIEYLFDREGSAGESVGSQADSLTQIGGSVPELVLKLLGPALFFCILAVVLVAWVYLEKDGRLHRETDGLTHYFVVALFGLVVLFGIYFFGSTGDMYLRVFGFSMVLVTIMGAVLIAHEATIFSEKGATDVVHSIIVLAFAILIVVSLVAVFPSPYIYDNSPHVTDQSMSAHETAFERGEEGVTFVGIRSGPNRYADATNQELDRTRIHSSISGPEIEEGIAGQYDDDRYLLVGQADRDRELIAYRGLRYTETQLNSIDGQYGVDRVQTNGEVEVYYVSSGES